MAIQRTSIQDHILAMGGKAHTITLTRIQSRICIITLRYPNYIVTIFTPLNIPPKAQAPILRPLQYAPWTAAVAAHRISRSQDRHDSSRVQ